jgi:hypothetical protein
LLVVVRAGVPGRDLVPAVTTTRSWRSVTCGVCGAPRTAIDDAQFIACEFCGAVYDVSAQRWFDPAHQTEAFARTKAAAFWGSKAAGRFARLGDELARSTPASLDDRVYRAKSEEYHYVYTMLFPDRVPRAVTASPAARVAWAKQAAAVAHVALVDPQIRALYAELNDSFRGFGDTAATADAYVAAATKAVERATRVYVALQSHPELVGQFRAPASYYARSTVRASLLTMLGVLRDPEIYPRVALEVFGDRHGVGEDCTHCGAPLVDRDRELERCSHCGSVLERCVDDPWISSRVALFRATLDERHRRNEIDTYVTALAAFSFVGSFARAGSERVATYLRRAMPWLPAEALRFAAHLHRDSIAPGEQAAFAGALAALEPWTPVPSERPLPPPPPADAFDEEAWLEKARVYWSHASATDDPVLAALSIAIIDVLVAPANARPPISATLVLRFFDEVLRHVPQEERRRRLDVAVLGYGDGPAGDLVRAIRDSH